MPLNAVMPDECETCEVTLASLHSKEPKQTLHVFMGMWMCPTCEHKERELQTKANSPAAIAARVQASRQAIDVARQIDTQIVIKEDIFNAQTVGIMALKKAIDDNPEIENKPAALAAELHTRFIHLQKLVFEARATLVASGNEQRAIQQYMNTLANQLRQEEREKYKLTDINYQPDVVKPPKPRKESSGNKRGPKKGPTRDEVKLAADKYKVPMDLIMVMCVSKNITADEAGRQIAVKMGLITEPDKK